MRILLERRPLSADAVLERDEALLTGAEAAVRVGQFASPAVSFGVSQRETRAEESAAREVGVPSVHRKSGGSSLLHLPGDIFWSVVLPRSHPLAGSGFVHQFGALGGGWVDLLEAHRIVARWERPRVRREDYCLLSSRGPALLVGDRALGGASQHVTSRALLHHGVVSASLRPDLLARIFRLTPEEIADGLTSLDAEGVTLGASALSEVSRRLVRCLGEP